MNNKTKMTYIALVAVFLVAIIFIVGKMFIGNSNSQNKVVVTEDVKNLQTAEKEPDVAQVSALPLPTEEELKSHNLENISVKEKLTEKFALGNYTLNDKSALFEYKAREVTTGERLYLKVLKADENEYKLSLPSNSTTHLSDDGINICYVDRTINYVSDDFEVDTELQKAIEEGKTELERGNSLTREVIPVKRIYWYKDGYEYQIESRYRNEYNFEELYKLYKDLYGI